MINEFDYVIVGAGTAGCVLAARLSEDPHVRVLLIEAGGKSTSWKIDMPAALAYPMQDARWNWGYMTEPQSHLNRRRIHWPRGRVLGGSSAINGMVYVRGHPLDYERWVKEGAEGWGWSDVLPYFKRAEGYELGGGQYRGSGGPLKVRKADGKNRLYDAWLNAGREADYGVSDDLNAFRQEGFGLLDMTVHRGRRWSAFRAYLAPSLGRSNLTVIQDSLALSITFEGRRATGVEFATGHAVQRARAEREVILAAGAINSPQLLQLSGVGCARLLHDHEISVVADRPEVGRNLQDHLCLYIQQSCITGDSLAKSLTPFNKALTGLRWFATKTGLGASNHFEAGGFIRTRAGIEHPDLQYHFFPLAIGYENKKLRISPSYQVDACILRPESRGSVRIKSTDPTVPPLIDPNYLSEEADREFFRSAVRLTREIFSQPAFSRFRGEEILPGEEVKSDAQLDDFVRRTAESAYHPSCTCRMGSDARAVVDTQCRVNGVEGLRVVDASIMPSITSGNLNAPTIMLAERAADLILEKPALPADCAPYYIAFNWEEAQR